MIYLDNAATTKPFESVVRRMEEFYTDKFFNPSALYAPAASVNREIDSARRAICNCLGGKGKLYFTSCATESNTWVYNSGVKNKKGNVVLSLGEHASVYENARVLVGKGIDVRFVKLTPSGTVDIDDFVRKLDEQTTLISIIHCSNETGAINDIAKLSKFAKDICPKALFHSDGVQALGKIDTNLSLTQVDLYSVSAHKIGGPKGIGALWVRDGIRLNPLLSGGGQESGYRSGTENTAGIAGFAEALEIFRKTLPPDVSRIREELKAHLIECGDVYINEAEFQSPYILSFSAKGIKAEILQRKLCEDGIIIGLGSACSARQRNNRVLAAMGHTMSRIEGSVRISFSPENIKDDMHRVGEAICKNIELLRRVTGE